MDPPRINSGKYGSRGYANYMYIILYSIFVWGMLFYAINVCVFVISCILIYVLQSVELFRFILPDIHLYLHTTHTFKRLHVLDVIIQHSTLVT